MKLTITEKPSKGCIHFAANVIDLSSFNFFSGGLR